MAAESIILDLRAGGLGDNWMRLAGFYVASGLRPHIKLCLIIPSNLVRVARHAFSDRLEISDTEHPEAVVYTVRGLRTHIGSTLTGNKFASPYGRVVIHDTKRWNLKDRLNSLAFTLCDQFKLVYSPPWNSLRHYQGYAEVVTLPQLRDISAEEFEAQLLADAALIRARLQSAPTSPEFTLPEDLAQKTIVFPTGTSRQFVPLAWAQTHLPNAIYAFFHRDPDLVAWRKAGLEVTPFYREPGDMLALAKAARATASTDSFPSHFLQYSAPRFVVMLTELPRHRIVSPAFQGPVVPSVAPCHPCPHLARTVAPLCHAGHPVCLNWQSPQYTSLIKKALESAARE